MHSSTIQTTQSKHIQHPKLIQYSAFVFIFKFGVKKKKVFTSETK